MNKEEQHDTKAKEEREDYCIASGVFSGIGLSIIVVSQSPLGFTPTEGLVTGFVIIVAGLIIFTIGRKKTV